MRKPSCTCGGCKTCRIRKYQRARNKKIKEGTWGKIKNKYAPKTHTRKPTKEEVEKLEIIRERIDKTDEPKKAGRKPTDLGHVIEEIEIFLKEHGNSAIAEIVSGINYGRALVDKAIHSGKIEDLSKMGRKYYILGFEKKEPEPKEVHVGPEYPGQTPEQAFGKMGEKYHPAQELVDRKTYKPVARKRPKVKHFGFEFIEVVDTTRLGLEVDVQKIGKTLRVVIGITESTGDVIKFDLGSVKERITQDAHMRSAL